ncbi:hypothetical protein F5B19DRAFT_399743 [Rostrohypoxylon terebratum]|nr:hypothetical protein F5B19DRAFT_399743 [Rostrohypoxylon terebratum]
MDSAPKRRKTSPTTSVPVGGSDAPPTLNSPARRPPRQRRPSFASPTKASLARSNPDILERRSASRAPETDDGTGTATGEAQSTAVEQTWSPIRRATGAMASKPRRTPNKQSSHPIPQPPAAENANMMNPFKGRALRRSPPPGAPVPKKTEVPEIQEPVEQREQAEQAQREEHEEPRRPEIEEEPQEPQGTDQLEGPEESREEPREKPEEQELPPTPTQKGISDPAAVNTSPAGIHNTPTKRPRRSRALAERLKSSPLKQPPLFPPGPTKESMREESPSRAAAKLRTLREQPQRPKKRKSHSARNFEEPDPLAEKKTLRDSLLAEVAHLKSDLELVTRENHRLHQLQTRWDNAARKGPEDKDGLLDILRRHVLPPEKEAPLDPTQDWLEAALNPISFLPFSKPNTSLPNLFAPEESAEKETDKPPPSHHPIPMTADEELPYLQVFTPLSFTSTVSIVPRDDPSSQGSQGPLTQKHVISVSSTPPGLFAARVEMTVNTKSLSISELSVPRLEPSAVSELGPFIEKIVQGGGTSALTRNVSIITWAMGEWLRVAMKRARFWCAVERDLGSSGGLAKCAAEMRTDTRKRGPGRPPAVDGSDDEDEDGQEQGTKKARFTKADLLPQLGRTSLDMELSDPDGAEEVPSIRIEWHIEFDWTGEAQSKIELLLGVPPKWHGHDKRGSLTSIPGMFGKLVQENKDPMEALRTIVALLVGEG